MRIGISILTSTKTSTGFARGDKFRRKPKLFLFFFEKPLDKLMKVCYNLIVRKRGKRYDKIPYEHKSVG